MYKAASFMYSQYFTVQMKKKIHTLYIFPKLEDAKN